MRREGKHKTTIRICPQNTKTAIGTPKKTSPNKAKLMRPKLNAPASPNEIFIIANLTRRATGTQITTVHSKSLAFLSFLRIIFCSRRRLAFGCRGRFLCFLGLFGSGLSRLGALGFRFCDGGGGWFLRFRCRRTLFRRFRFGDRCALGGRGFRGFPRRPTCWRRSSFLCRHCLWIRRRNRAMNGAK